MGIEWTSRLALSDGVEGKPVAGEWQGKRAWSLVVGRPGITVRGGVAAISLIVKRAVWWAAAQSSASPRVLERERAVNKQAGR